MKSSFRPFLPHRVATTLAILLVAPTLLAQTSNESTVSVGDWNAGTPSNLTNQQDPGGANISSGLVNSGFGNADGQADAHVDTVTVPSAFASPSASRLCQLRHAPGTSPRSLPLIRLSAR